MSVIIGIDPHKASHAAVAIDDDEHVAWRARGPADRGQMRPVAGVGGAVRRGRTWAIESAGGLGYLLAQQLVAAGEHVVDVPPTLSARVRLLGSGRSRTRTTRNDALSTAIAALRHCGLRAVRAMTTSTVLRLLAKAHHDLDAAADSGRVPVARARARSWSAVGTAVVVG